MERFNVTPSSSRAMFDEEDNNGLVLCDKYLPVEILIEIFEIFCHADYKSLLSCQLVCKRWKMLIDNIWRKRTERTLGRPLPWNDNKMPWSVYYLACAKKPFERNLVKNHSGTEGENHWAFSHNNGDYWTVEEPPFSMPELPQTEPLFKDRQICFATTFEYCTNIQVIVLTDEGIHPYILDTYQPPIVVSEWYGCPWPWPYYRSFVPATYQLKVQLFRTDKKLIDEFQFTDVLRKKKQNRWLKVSHVFKNYGCGLRRIIFEHSGSDRSYWVGHCGLKMAGACVYVKIF